MPSVASCLCAASALVIFSLGAMHLAITFRGNRLHPRDATLTAQLELVSPVISRETTMWKAWIGFNASHSLGAILYGLVYGYLALVHPQLFFASPYLLILGAAFLGGYVFLGRCYWFSVPFRGIVLATVLYVAAIVADRA